jgi:membrane-bound lytic murein transglycosylase D
MEQNVRRAGCKGTGRTAAVAVHCPTAPTWRNLELTSRRPSHHSRKSKVSASRRLPLALPLLLAAACSSAPPPAVAPPPEPEPEEVAVETEPAPVPQIPIAERVRAPFAVLSEGRPTPREERRGVVVLETRQQRPPAPADTAAPPAGRTTQTAAATAPARTPASGGEPATRPAAPPAGSAPAAGRTPAPRQHTVQAGETFFAVARRYEVTPSALAAVNPGIDFDRLRAGQVLQLPAYATLPGSRGTTAQAPPPATPPARPAPAQPAPQRPPAQGRTHTVASGETLWSIARRYDVTPEQIRRANRMDSDLVRLGQRLVIP